MSLRRETRRLVKNSIDKNLERTIWRQVVFFVYNVENRDIMNIGVVL